MTEMMKFDSPKNQSSIIKVIGVGGGGSNAVTHMFKQGIKGVDFILCNTDAQALATSPVPSKIQLGSKGLGAGSVPSVGREAALENIEEIKSILETNTKMLFITAGMGGGTGTGAAPVIAAIARELEILSVGIVTIPFSFEGRKRRQQAEQGIEEMRKYVDTLLVICNDKLRELYGNVRLSEAFCKADNILATAAKGIAEIITVPGYINVDFEDVKTVMKDSGVAIMGTGIAEGEDRAHKAIEEALASPLLNDSNIKGASNILLYITSGKEEITMDEVSEITDFIQEEAGHSAEIIWGNSSEDSLGEKVCITVIATGFGPNCKKSGDLDEEGRKVIHTLDEVPLEPIYPIKEEPKGDLVNEITLITKIPDQDTPAPEGESDQEREERTFVFDINQVIKENLALETPSDLKTDKEAEKKAAIISSMASEGQKTYETARDILQIDTIKNELEVKSMERIKKLKDLSIKLKTPAGLAELENEPAYIRRHVKLNEVTPSESSSVARYVLMSDDENNPEIKTNNSFLHDNVD
jgi:cell division protein FtsZ